MTILEMFAAKKAALAAASEIQKKAEAEEATDEEITECNELIASAKRLKGEIEAAEKRKADALAMGKTIAEEAAWDAAPQERISAPVDPSGDSTPTIVGGRDSAKFSHFGEYMFQVRRAALQPAATDPRLADGLHAAAPGMRTDVDSLGGFLIPDQFADGILERMYNTGELLSRIKAEGMYMSLAGNTIKLPRVDESSRATGSRSGGVRGYWVEETGTLTDSKPNVGQMTLTLHKAAALGYTTEEMLEDLPVAGQFLERLLTQELIFTVEDSLVNGNGSNKPLGILAANVAVEVSKITNQTAATIWGDNITAMWARMWAPSRPTAIWLYNQSIEPFLWSLTLAGRFGSESTSVDGIPLFAPAGSITNQGKYSTLMGRPAIPVEYTKAVGTVGDIILWDPAQYVLVDKGGVKSASSIHVQFLTDQLTFRVTYRVDGQPTWDQALTPFDAGDTLSTIVTLAVRS